MKRQQGLFRMEYWIELKASKLHNRIKINHLNSLLHQKELELSQLKQQIKIEKMEWSQPQIQGEVVMPRAGHAGTTIDDKWYIVGGGENKSGATETLVLNMSRLVWSIMTSMKERDPLASEARKGGWRYLDTGQVLIETACSVERVEEVLNMLHSVPMLPEIQYFRFNPVDERCGMELDETDPAISLKLEVATQEYIQSNFQAFKSLCERLVYQNEEKWPDKLKSQYPIKSDPSSAVLDENCPSLGWRRMVILVEPSHSPDTGKAVNHARALETFCTRNSIRISLMNKISGFPKPATTFSTPFASPLFTGSFPSSPLILSPEIGPQRINRIDLVPPLSLDGFQMGKASVLPPNSPSPRQLSLPVRSLHEKLQNSPQVGIIHLALQNDSVGLILSWKNDVFVVAEPGELAERFLHSVKLSFSSTMRGRSRKDVSALAKVLTVADLVAYKPNLSSWVYTSSIYRTPNTSYG